MVGRRRAQRAAGAPYRLQHLGLPGAGPPATATRGDRMGWLPAADQAPRRRRPHAARPSASACRNSPYCRELRSGASLPALRRLAAHQSRRRRRFQGVDAGSSPHAAAGRRGRGLARPKEQTGLASCSDPATMVVVHYQAGCRHSQHQPGGQIHGFCAWHLVAAGTFGQAALVVWLCCWA